MPAGPVVRVEGARELRRTMRAARRDLDDLKNLHRSVAQQISPAAITAAPVGPAVQGHIRDTTRVGATKTAAFLRVGGARKPYGPPIHWGWPARGIKGQPWLVEAAHRTEPRWTDTYLRGIEKILDQIKGA